MVKNQNGPLLFWFPYLQFLNEVDTISLIFSWSERCINEQNLLTWHLKDKSKFRNLDQNFENDVYICLHHLITSHKHQWLIPWKASNQTVLFFILNLARLIWKSTSSPSTNSILKSFVCPPYVPDKMTTSNIAHIYVHYNLPFQNIYDPGNHHLWWRSTSWKEAGQRSPPCKPSWRGNWDRTVMNMTLLMIQDACHADIVDLFCHLVIFCAPPAENAIGAGGLEADQTPISALNQMFQDFNTFPDKFWNW